MKFEKDRGSLVEVAKKNYTKTIHFFPKLESDRKRQEKGKDAKWFAFKALWRVRESCEKLQKSSKAVDIVGVIGSSPTNPTARKL